MLSVADDTTTAFYAVAVDEAGNVSACAGPVTYAEDSTPPAAPALSALAPDDDNTPRLKGTAAAGSTVRVYTDASCSGSPVATGTAAELASSGIALSVADDTTTAFYAVAVDEVGNVSACSDGVTYVEDSTPPAAPDLTAFPSGPANGNSPRLEGTAEPGTTIRAYTDPSCTGSPVATGTAAALAGSGIPLTVADETTTAFYAVAVDEGRQRVGLRGPRDLRRGLHDRVADRRDRSGLPANDNAPRLARLRKAGATVAIYTTPDCSGTPVASGTAAEFASPGIALPPVADDTTTSYRVRATDEAGNISDCAGPFTYIEDSSAVTPLFTGLGAGSTSDEPRFTGVAEPGATVRLYATPDCSGLPLASGTAEDFAGPGIAVPVDGDGATVYADQVDAVGNASACSAPIRYVKAPSVEGPPAVVLPPPAVVAPVLPPGTCSIVGVHQTCKRIPRLTRHTLKGSLFILRRFGLLDAPAHDQWQGQAPSRPRAPAVAECRLEAARKRADRGADPLVP